MKPGQLVGISPQMESRGSDNWAERGACWGSDTPDDWFGGPDTASGPREYAIKRAKKVCAACPVIAQCLNAGLTGGEKGKGERDGIWGGINFADPDERRQARTRTCKAGHIIKGRNALTTTGGYLVCRACNNAQRRATYALKADLAQRIVLQRDQLDRIVAEALA